MVQADNSAENQHYVPQLLLRNFRDEADDQIRVFDKHTKKIFSTNPKNIASERNFYVLEGEQKTLSLEPALQTVEDNAKGVIAKILREESVSNLDENENIWLILFVAVQFLRTRSQLELFKHMIEGLKQRTTQLGYPESVPEMTAFDLKRSLLLHISEGIPTIAEAIATKYCFIIKTVNDRPFWTSDHPVVQHNDFTCAGYGNLGFKNKGIQIYFPLSPLITLAFWCPSIGNQIVKSRNHARTALAFEKMNPGRSGVNAIEFYKAHLRIEQLYRVLMKKEPLLASPENVTMMNSLQVTFSHRFVLSQTGEFELANRMLRDDSKYSSGLKPMF